MILPEDCFISPQFLTSASFPFPFIPLVPLLFISPATKSALNLLLLPMVVTVFSFSAAS